MVPGEMARAGVGERTGDAVIVDEKTRQWSTAHAQDADFYTVPGADKAFFLKQMRSPVVTAIAAIGRARQQPLKILEVGCGSGADSICLALQGHEVTTLDVSPHLLAEARKLSVTAARLFGESALPIRFAPGDVFELGEHAGQFDVVLSFGLTVIWPEEAKRLAAVANMRSTLKEEGWLLLGTTHTLNPLFRVIPLTPLVADLAGHDLPILEREVTRAGFSVVERGAAGLSPHFHQWLTSPVAAFPLRAANFVFERLPKRWQLPIAPHIFVVARKEVS